MVHRLSHHGADCPGSPHSFWQHRGLLVEFLETLPGWFLAACGDGEDAAGAGSGPFP